jgi:hypothetical protein
MNVWQETNFDFILEPISCGQSWRFLMDPWEENMVAGLRQQIKDLKAENEKLKQELKKLSSKNSQVAA